MFPGGPRQKPMKEHSVAADALGLAHLDEGGDCGCWCEKCWRQQDGGGECICWTCGHRENARNALRESNTPPSRIGDWMAGLEEEPDYSHCPVADTDAFIDFSGHVFLTGRQHQADRNVAWLRFCAESWADGESVSTPPVENTVKIISGEDEEWP